ncbi:MAG: hypothetical protein AB4042_11305, partial [Leptolyngbyaceae cyanobacterium]
VLDLNNNGVELISLDQSSVTFDMDNDGVGDRTGWLSPEDGFLAYDRNGDGQINNITELFSEYHSPGAHTGLQALATLDSNHDQQIDIQDAAFTELSVWRDRNTDGITDPGELVSIRDAGISAIALTSTPSGENRDGNIILSTTQAQRTDGSAIAAAEVAFLVKPGVKSGDNVDELIGGESDRTLVLQSEADTLHLDALIDTRNGRVDGVQDVEYHQSDRLVLPASGLNSNLVSSGLPESPFSLGSAAERGSSLLSGGQSQRPIDNSSTDLLFFEADDTGSTAQVQLAQLNGA